MTKGEAELERDRKADEDPKSTWFVAESSPGDWSVVRLGLKPAAPAEGTTVEAHAQPNPAEDPRSAIRKNLGPEYI